MFICEELIVPLPAGLVLVDWDDVKVGKSALK